jgi:hypothetical protein
MRAKYFTSILCCLPWALQASESAPSSVEAKAGYFFFTSSNMRHVYDNGGADVQVSGAWGFSHWLRLYGSVEYLQKSGHSLNGHQRSSIWELPLSLGLQPFVSLYSRPCSHKNVSGYFTLGPRYFYAHIHNHSDYVDHSMNQNGLGGFANLGLLFSFNPHFVADLFGEYSYCKLHFHSSHYAAQGHSVDIGGLTFGGGLGYVF